jgi:hypothetical protein
MYEFLDRPVTGLDHGGRFLVWSMRSWVGAAGEKTCPANRLAPAFARWQMLSGFQPFLRMMALFNRYGLAELGFGALRCNHVSEHEAIILSLLASLRDGRRARLPATLAMLVDEDGIGGLIEALAQLGNAMDAAGIYPQPPVAELPSGNSAGSGRPAAGPGT